MTDTAFGFDDEEEVHPWLKELQERTPDVDYSNADESGVEIEYEEEDLVDRLESLDLVDENAFEMLVEQDKGDQFLEVDGHLTQEEINNLGRVWEEVPNTEVFGHFDYRPIMKRFFQQGVISGRAVVSLNGQPLAGLTPDPDIDEALFWQGM